MIPARELMADAGFWWFCIVAALSGIWTVIVILRIAWLAREKSRRDRARLQQMRRMIYGVTL